jgi:L-ascorbate metabolism protein UlaG (beta-lactamase superfamily)
MAVTVTWLGHATFRLSDGRVVYIDPWKVREAEAADVVVVSHEHFDHLSVEDVRKLLKPETVVVAPPDCVRQLPGTVRALGPGGQVEAHGVRIEGVRAYNIGKPFHPKEKNWLGVVVAMEGKRIYYAGDTDLISEMEALEDIDLALLPVGGTYTMNAEEAVQAAQTIQPRLAVPYHWGDIVGSEADARTFVEGFPRGQLLRPGEAVTLE